MSGEATLTASEPYEGPIATVDLDALAHNTTAVRRRLTPGVKVLAAVKANAYGHGLPATAVALEKLGVEWFGVATPSEAFTLRTAGIRGGVLLLTPVREPAVVTQLVAAGVSLVVADLAGLAALAACDLPSTAAVQLKVDTGMGRLGVTWQAAPTLARAIDSDGRFELQGTFTHLAASEEEDRSATLEQLQQFERALAGIRAEGIDPGLVHAANSAAIVAYPEHHYDMVRPGISLFGYYPGESIARLEPDLRQVMCFDAPVTYVKRLKRGDSVSYGGLWHAQRETVVATLRVGYADGYRRSLTGKSWVGFKGRRLPVIGRVCMDQMMVDATDLGGGAGGGVGGGVGVGDRMVLWGPGGPSAEDLAATIGTVSYELLTGVAARVKRGYLGGAGDVPDRQGLG